MPALLLLLVILAGGAAAGGAEIPAPTDAPAPLTPAQSAAAFSLPDGFRVEVVASEPLIASPSAVCWDERGRMFVGELHGYNLEGQLDIDELNKGGVLDTKVRRVEADERFKRAAKSGTYGVVKMLTSSRGDGVLDTVKVLARDLPPVYGLVPARGGVIVACVPSIIYLAERDGDGAPAVREVLFEGFKEGEMWRGVNCPQYGADGWITFGQGWPGGTISGPHLAKPVHLPQADFRIRPDGSAIEPVTGATGTFGFALTDAGDRFVTDTTQPANFVAPLPYRYLVRNPDAPSPASSVHTGDSHAYARALPHPWRQKRADDPAYYKFYHDAYGAAESDANGWFTAACGPLVYRDSALPGLHGQYFVCEPALDLIHRSEIRQQGSLFAIHRLPGEEKSEFLASSDAWCHPIALSHGPDGALWIVDYYREIIEDYSAIPRHLQQQYGVYRGHDYGRIYRLVHRDMPASPPPDMSRLDPAALAQELGSPLLWRRQTAQRLLSERGAGGGAGGAAAAVPHLRAWLLAAAAPPQTLIAALRTLDALGALGADDLRPLLTHSDAAVRIHALQLADARFAGIGGAALLDAALSAAAAEADARVQIQDALSLGESDDARALAQLVRFARERLAVRFMDAALLSSLHGRGVLMLNELLRDPGAGASFITPVTRTISAARDEGALASALTLIAGSPSERQIAVLTALNAGRAGAPGFSENTPARAVLARIAASQSTEVRAAAATLEASLSAARQADRAPSARAAQSDRADEGRPPPEVSEDTVRTYLAALAAPRDLQRGHMVYLQSCSPCHRIGKEGSEVGPDLLGEIGVAEETTLRSILLPSERIRPGFETTLVSLSGGGEAKGLLKEDGPTSLTLVAMGGVEQVVLRREVTGVRRTATSLMPPFAPVLGPGEVADVIAWLRSTIGMVANEKAVLFDEEADFAERFDEGGGTAAVVLEGAYSGRACLRVSPPQRAARKIKGWNYHIVEHPLRAGEFRYLQFAWRCDGEGVMIELAQAGRWPRAEDAAGRYFAGANTTGWMARQLSPSPPRRWTLATVDLWHELGDNYLTGCAPTAIGGTAWFDQLVLLRTPPEAGPQQAAP